ncbi:RNA 2',3'-cyclic phosphodiesterase [Vanrija pseudolonga]|uniref:RNA 2',3'-cyclic phosphodiesterase n=1 Tax=Vanrija pseudolonga TaxID=143232 RepID=A0AAF0Y4H6_9TREE|nr:RNA 2',3'-cyclic phosphodiesterase [Vanrija pseudolonga]
MSTTLRRCFIALDITPQARTALTSVLDEMHALRGADKRAAQVLSPVPAANLHLTLAFLGDIDDSAVDKLSMVLTAVASTQRPITNTQIDGMGWDGSARRPRLIYAPVSSGRDVFAFAGVLSRLCADLGIGKQEQSPYVPHITLARVDGNAGDPRSVGEWMTAYPPRSWGAIDGSAIVLYESRRDSRQYIPLLRAPLSG